MAADPKVTIVETAAEVGEMAAAIVADTMRQHPGAAISVPTGSTPIGMFKVLAGMVARGDISFVGTPIFCLDEYLGVTGDDPNSLTGWLKANFLEPAGVPLANVHTLPSTASDPHAAAADYEREIVAAGGLELAVLGIGNNGHIAYNEPGSAADSRTRVLDLTRESIAQAEGYFQGRTVPTKAMSMGVGTLLEARRIVLIAHGAGKAEIMRRALREPMTSEVPASWLRLSPEKVEVILDRAAAANL